MISSPKVGWSGYKFVHIGGYDVIKKFVRCFYFDDGHVVIFLHSHAHPPRAIRGEIRGANSARSSQSLARSLKIK